MRRCPVPECGHIGDIITNYHCKSEHGMTRAEVKEKYGNPIEVKSVHNAREFNKWMKENLVMITSAQFDGADTATSRLKGKRKIRKDL